MHVLTTVIATLASLAVALPSNQQQEDQVLQRRQDEGQRTEPSKYYGISLNINMDMLTFTSGLYQM